MAKETEMQDSKTVIEQIPSERWEEVSLRLRAPFSPEEVDFRVQGRANEQTGRGQVVAYIDARSVQDRLDAVVGAGNWSFDWTPVVVDNGEVQVAKGTLTIYGVSKSDAGSASNFEQTLGAVSHCFKRAAVHWGVGRYLYNLPSSWVQVEKGGRISETVLRELRSKLPRPATGQVTANEGERVADAPVERKRTSTRSASASEPVARPVPAATTAAPAQRNAPTNAPASEPMATEQQLRSISKLCEALGRPEPEPVITLAQARELISQLSGEYQRMRRAS
jgi:hypothetical protein